MGGTNTENRGKAEQVRGSKLSREGRSAWTGQQAEHKGQVGMGRGSKLTMDGRRERVEAHGWRMEGRGREEGAASSTHHGQRQHNGP